MSIHHRLFLKLHSLLPELDLLTAGDSLRLESSGRPPFSVEVLHRDGPSLLLTLAHRADPTAPSARTVDMDVRVHLQAGTVEALTYRDPHRFDRLERMSGQARIKLERSLNDFLSLWLSNLRAQGYAPCRDCGAR